jgi:chorismate mutase
LSFYFGYRDLFRARLKADGFGRIEEKKSTPWTRSLLERLNKRVQLAQQVGHYKLERGMEVYVPSREEEVFGQAAGEQQGAAAGQGRELHLP